MRPDHAAALPLTNFMGVSIINIYKPTILGYPHLWKPPNIYHRSKEPGNPATSLHLSPKQRMFRARMLDSRISLSAARFSDPDKDSRSWRISTSPVGPHLLVTGNPHHHLWPTANMLRMQPLCAIMQWFLQMRRFAHLLRSLRGSRSNWPMKTRDPDRSVPARSGATGATATRHGCGTRPQPSPKRGWGGPRPQTSHPRCVNSPGNCS